jgi:hypothetical protein
MVRVLAFMLRRRALAFGKGLSAEDEPDLWRKDLTGAIELWIEVGLPDEKRIRRACGRASQVVVLTYGGRVADMWWQQNKAALRKQRQTDGASTWPRGNPRAGGAGGARHEPCNARCRKSEIWLIVDGESLHIVPEIRLAARQR